MNPFALTAEALHEPWRLWTCHLVHFGWEHALTNLIALTVPAVLTHPQDRRQLLATALIAAPLLSLLLLPGLAEGQYRGASGLVCAVWAWAGLRLITRGEARTVGLAMLGGLACKLVLEGALGRGLLPAHLEWQALPAAHVWGALLGLGAVLPQFLDLRSTAVRRA
jgi:membrane associated rhomboid family serine protease